MKLYIGLLESKHELLKSDSLSFIPFSESEGAIISQQHASDLFGSSHAVPVFWGDPPRHNLCQSIQLVGSFELTHASHRKICLPRKCHMWKEGRRIESEHLYLILCPSVAPLSLQRAAETMPRRCVMDELFEDHQMAGPSKQKEQDIESWLWDWIVPRKLSIPSTLVPQAANSLIKGWIDCVKLDKDYPLISAVLNQVVNILAAYCSLQYLPTLLFHLGSLETSLHDLVAGAFDAFAQGMPAGIKLHTELATILSQVICFAEFARLFWSSLLAVILEQSGELLVFMNAFAIVVLGFKFYLCIASDAINIFLHLHWRFIHFLSAYVFRFHLMALQYSWGIMRRGKKARRNDLDQENVLPSIEHIVAGVLLFVPLLALLPTTVVFHCLTLAASTVTALPDALISRLMRMRSNIPRGIAVSHIPTIDDATVYQIKSRFH